MSGALLAPASSYSADNMGSTAVVADCDSAVPASMAISYTMGAPRRETHALAMLAVIDSRTGAATLQPQRESHPRVGSLCGTYAGAGAWMYACEIAL